MPLIYRAMIREGDHPRIGPTAKSLGVRVSIDGAPPAGDFVERAGIVGPGVGGMSVAPTWPDLPMHRVPKRLVRLAPKAIGDNNYECWRMGDGPFEAGAVAEGLSLRPTRPGHGLVEPSRSMTSREYQGFLAATRDEWRIEPETLP